MNVLSARCWMLGAVALVAIAGCEPEDQPSPWEIIEGTASLTSSRALDSATGSSLVTYGGRTGRLTIGADSSVTGWLKFTGQDTMYITGGEVSDDDGLVLVWVGATPTTYRIVTDGNFPDTYALISLDVFHGNIAGDSAEETYVVYWEFEK